MVNIRFVEHANHLIAEVPRRPTIKISLAGFSVPWQVIHRQENFMKLEPYKSQPVLYRAIAGDEYAAIITDIRESRICSLTTFPPAFALSQVSGIKYFERKADAADHRGGACYPAI
jgi:predicted lipase